MLPTSIKDIELIERIRQDDRLAFRMLFDRHYEFLLQAVMNITKDRNLSKDVGQEVFLELWKKRQSIQIKSSVKSYLHRSMINRTLNLIKSRKLKYQEPESLPETPSTDNLHQKLEVKQLQQLINEAIDDLPERCRMIFTLCRLEGLSHKEIAQKLDISTKTVENQMTKALKILRKVVQPYVSKGPLLLL